MKLLLLTEFDIFTHDTNELSHFMRRTDEYKSKALGTRYYELGSSLSIIMLTLSTRLIKITDR